ncbi:hypothetical protein D9M68_186240 [compost metagenome]
MVGRGRGEGAVKVDKAAGAELCLRHIVGNSDRDGAANTGTIFGCRAGFRRRGGLVATGGVERQVVEAGEDHGIFDLGRCRVVGCVDGEGGSDAGAGTLCIRLGDRAAFRSIGDRQRSVVAAERDAGGRPDRRFCCGIRHVERKRSGNAGVAAAGAGGRMRFEDVLLVAADILHGGRQDDAAVGVDDRTVADDRPVAHVCDVDRHGGADRRARGFAFERRAAIGDGRGIHVVFRLQAHAAGSGAVASRHGAANGDAGQRFAVGDVDRKGGRDADIATAATAGIGGLARVVGIAGFAVGEVYLLLLLLIGLGVAIGGFVVLVGAFGAGFRVRLAGAIAERRQADRTVGAQIAVRGRNCTVVDEGERNRGADRGRTDRRAVSRGRA